jgi:heme exporter protein CcmD
MEGLGPHGNFIIAAYAIAAVTLGALILWTAVDYCAQRKIVRELEASRTRNP